MLITASAFQAMKQPEKAEEFYQKSIQKNPKSFKALNNLGLSALQKNDLPKAQQFFTQAKAANPNDAMILNNGAQLLLRQKKNDLAIQSL